MNRRRRSSSNMSPIEGLLLGFLTLEMTEETGPFDDIFEDSDFDLGWDIFSSFEDENIQLSEFGTCDEYNSSLSSNNSEDEEFDFEGSVIADSESDDPLFGVEASDSESDFENYDDGFEERTVLRQLHAFRESVEEEEFNAMAIELASSLVGSSTERDPNSPLIENGGVDTANQASGSVWLKRSLGILI